VKRLSVALLAFCVVCASAEQARSAIAEDAYKITPDVVYKHKAGMALTFDVIQPKKPNGAGILFMVSGGSARRATRETKSQRMKSIARAIESRV
jgi:hypothetical protein